MQNEDRKLRAITHGPMPWQHFSIWSRGICRSHCWSWLPQKSFAYCDGNQLLGGLAGHALSAFRAIWMGREMSEHRPDLERATPFSAGD